MRRLAIVAGVLVVLVLAADPGRFGAGLHCNREQVDEDHLRFRCQVSDAGWPCRNKSECELECLCTQLLPSGTPSHGRCASELPIHESYCIVENGLAVQRTME
jgi:hypothetical protein